MVRPSVRPCLRGVCQGGTSIMIHNMQLSENVPDLHTGPVWVRPVDGLQGQLVTQLVTHPIGNLTAAAGGRAGGKEFLPLIIII